MTTAATPASGRRNRRPAVASAAAGTVDAPRTQDTVVASLSMDAQRRHAMVRDAAYFRSERRGFCPGHELDDWLSAEAEIDRALTSVDPINPSGA